MRFFETVTALIPKAAGRAGISAEVMAGVLAHLTQRIQVLSSDAYKAKRPEAQRLCKEAEWGDDEYVALALALNAAIWTYDHDFQRIPGVRIVGTTEVDEME